MARRALEQVVRIDVHEDRLAVELKSADGEDASKAADDSLLSIPWRKPPSRNPGKFLSRTAFLKVKSAQRGSERRARLVSAIARGRRWLDEIVSGSVTDVQQIASRQKCSVRQVNMTISLAFPRTRPRARRGRRSFATRHRSRATSRCSARMEPAVRSPRIESAIITDRV